MRVPVYDQQQVAPQAAPDVRAQALVDPAAGAVGQGLQQLGEGVEKASDSLDRVAARADAIWAANAHTSYMHDGTTVLDGNQGGTASQAAGDAAFDGSDDDVGHAPPTGPSSAATGAAGDPSAGVSAKGLLNEQGMAAAKYSHPTYDWLAKRKDEIAEAAPNGRAKQLFLESANTQLESYRATIERHVGEQNRVAGEQALQARSAVGLAAIGKDVSAPGVTDGNVLYSLDANVDEVVRTIKAVHPGELGDEQAAAYKQKATELVLQHYIDGKDFRGAQNLLDQRRQDLGDKADELGKTVKAGAAMAAADDQAKAVVGGAELKGTGGLHDIAAIDRALLDPAKKLTPEARKQVENYKGVAAEQNRGVASNHSSTLWSQYDQHNNAADVDPGEIQWAKDNDHDLYEKFQRQAAEDAAARSRPSRRPKGSTPDQDVQFNTWMWNHDRNRADYKDMTPEQLDHDFRGRVAQPQLQKMQDALREDKGQKPTSEASTPSWMRDRVIQRLNGDDSVGGKGNPALDPGMRGRVYNAVDEALRVERAAAKASGKDITAADVDRIATEQLGKVKVGGTGVFFDDTVPVAEYASNPKYRGKTLAEAPAVPDDAAKAIKAQLAAKGIDANDAQVADIYQRHLEAKVGAKRGAPAQAAPAAAPAQAAPPEEQNYTSADGSGEKDTQLIHPANRSVIDEAKAWLDKAATSSQRAQDQRQWGREAPWTASAREFEQRKAAAMKAHPDWKVDGEVIKSPDGSHAIRI